MSLDNAIHALSNINAFLGSTNGYINATQNGVPAGNALMDFGFNVMNGVIRNKAAEDIQHRTGSYIGYSINSAAGYGNPIANYNGTMGLIGASMLTSPFGIFGCGFNPYMTSSIYGCGPFFGGFFGGGCGCGNFFGGPSIFATRGFWC